MAEKTTALITYTASGSAVIFGLNANDFAALVGASVAVLSFITHLWFKWQHLKLAKVKAGIGDDE